MVVLFEIGLKLISDIRRDTVSFDMSVAAAPAAVARPAKSVFRQLYGVGQPYQFYEQLHKMPPDTAWRWWFVVAGGHHVYVKRSPQASLSDFYELETCP